MWLTGLTDSPMGEAGRSLVSSSGQLVAILVARLQQGGARADLHLHFGCLLSPLRTPDFIYVYNLYIVYT